MSWQRHKPKGRKRPKRWHHGPAQAERWAAVELPDVDSGADPTAGTPTLLRRGRHRHGDAL